MKSLKTKILSFYIFLMSITFIVTCISIYSLISLNKAVDGLIEANYRSIAAATNMLNSIERQDSSELIFIQIEDEKSIRSFYENQIEFITYLNKAKDNITEENEKKIIEEISNSYAEYIEDFSKIQRIKNTSGMEEATNYYDNYIYPKFLSVKKSCEKLSEINETAMFDNKDNAAINSKKQVYVITILSLILMIIGLIGALAYTKKIVNPIHRLIEGIKSVKSGNLNHEIRIEVKDEIGELAKEFNNMTKRLMSYDENNINNLISEKNKSIAIVKSISDPVIVTDNNYNIILLNKSSESIFGLSEEDALGNHFMESINNKVIFDKIKSTTNGDISIENKIINIDGLGKVFTYVHTVAPIHDNENKIIGVVTILQDITEIKELADVKSDFISTVSHELRTPLASLVMGTELLMNDAIGNLNIDQKEIVQAMDEDSNQLLDLINDLLDLSKLQSGKMNMRFELADINKLIRKSVDYFYDEANRRSIKIKCDLMEGIPQLKIDTNKISCVINNIISNALRFTTNNDEIYINTQRNENSIKVTIKDTGVGIPNEYKNSIFDKFVQVDNIENKGGTGLGLAISREFIKKHGGDIWLDNNNNFGSCFIFTLPLMEDVEK